MLYPDTSLDEWTRKYDLQIQSKKCANCNAFFETTVPVLIKGYAGLETPTHECGRNFNSAIFTPTTKESIQEWNELFFSSTSY